MLTNAVNKKIFTILSITIGKRKSRKLKQKLGITMQCLIFTLITSCGTLGGFQDRNFPTSKNKLEFAMDSLYVEHPEYNIPTRWKTFDNWSDRGYGFLESRIFYFKSPPEEMYYVTLVGDSTVLADSTNVTIAIRSVFNGITNRWLLNDDVDVKEKARIESRFDKEIISKLERYTKTKASRN
jgi:hypothetical protein